MHTAFFGDREREFALTPHLIPELQRTTGKAIGAIIDGLRRLSYAEITETIRLGLVGGGAQPEEAAALVATYVPARPLIDANYLAVGILTALWIGPEEPEFREATEDETADFERRINRAARNIMTEARAAAATGDLSAAINGGAA